MGSLASLGFEPEAPPANPLTSLGFEPETPDPIHANPQTHDELPTQEQFDASHQSVIDRMRAAIKPVTDEISQANEASKPFANWLGKYDERIKNAAETPIAPMLQNILRPPTQYDEPTPTTTAGKIAQGVGAGATHLAEGLTSPENIALLAGTGMVGMVPKIGAYLPRAVSAVFSVQMLKSAYDQVPEVKAAIAKGDAREAARAITEAVGTGLLGVAAGTHAIKGEPSTIIDKTAAVNEGVPENVHASVDAGMQALGFEPDQAPAKAGSTPPPDVTPGVPDGGTREAQLEVQNRKLKELGFEAQQPASTTTENQTTAAEVPAAATPASPTTTESQPASTTEGSLQGLGFEPEPEAPKMVSRDDSLKPEIASTLTPGTQRTNYKGGVETLTEVPLTKIERTDPGNVIYPEAVARYRENPSPVAPELRATPDGNFSTWEGNHRIEAASEDGKKSVLAWVSKAGPDGYPEVPGREPAAAEAQPAPPLKFSSDGDTFTLHEESGDAAMRVPLHDPEAVKSAAATMREMGEHDAADSLEGAAQDKTAGKPARIAPGTVTKIPTSSIQVDPARFQFKRDATGKSGVTDKLADVTTWNPDMAGMTHVWQDPADGKTYVVNGHHRVDLASRLNVENMDVRYLHANTAEEARTAGALINIGEDNGTAVDAAKLFRDGGMTPEDLRSRGVELKGKIARQGIALSKLDPFLFRKVIDGDLPVERAALIGEGVENPNDQRALFDIMQKSEESGKHLTNGTIGEMIRMANGETGKFTDTQTDLFGDHESTRSLIKEKAEVSDYVRTQLGKEKRLFAAVSTDSAAARLGDAGNVIQADENARNAQQTGQAQMLYDKLSTSAGQVSDSLNKAAREIAEGAKANDVKQRTYREIKESLLAQAKALGGGEGPHRGEPGELGTEGPREAGQGQPDLPASPKVAGLFGDFFKDTSGVIKTDKFTEAAGKFAERDLKPRAIKIAAGLSEAKDQTLRLIAPDMLSESAELTGLTLRERMAQYARRYDQAKQRMKDAWQFFDKRTADDNYAFMDDVERGLGRGGNPSTPANNGLEPIARVLARGLDQRRLEVQQLGEGALERFYTYYFPHLFERPEKVPQFVTSFFGGKANLEGPASFLKHREFPTMKEARAAGLKPISDNPIDLMLAKVREMDRYLLAHNTLRDLADRGIAKRVSVKDGPSAQMDLLGGRPLKPEWTVADQKDLPEGFRSIHDPIGGGKWFADDGAAQVLNNFLVPGLRAKSGLYRGAVGINNSMNQANMGLSAFHATGEALRSVMNRSALGMKDLFQGNPVRGSIRLATAPAGPFLDYLKGDKGSREWFKPGSEGAPTAAIIDNLMRGGARAQTEAEYINNSVASMKREARAGNYPGAAGRIVPAFFETMAKPLMQQLVPRIKLGAAMQMASQEMERLPATADVDDVRRVMAKVWDSADNRMGQMVYDNLFLNKTLKDIAHLGIRAVGWDIGTVREFGGGAIDAANLARGKKPVTYDRIAYTMSAAMTTALAGALYQYLHTGQGPQQVKDYFFPKREDGTRYSFPTDIKDVYHYATAPVRTIENKTSPLVNTAISLLHNRDFYDRPIRQEGDAAYKQGLEVLDFLGRQWLPFTVQPSAGKNKFPDPNLEHRVENFLGMGRASGDLQENQKQRKQQPSPY
jgi:hypothetical protein